MYDVLACHHIAVGVDGECAVVVKVDILYVAGGYFCRTGIERVIDDDILYAPLPEHGGIESGGSGVGIGVGLLG